MRFRDKQQGMRSVEDGDGASDYNADDRGRCGSVEQNDIGVVSWSILCGDACILHRCSVGSAERAQAKAEG